MFLRLINISKSNSFFVFGARGTGKSSLILEQFGAGREVYGIDLLLEAQESRYQKNPDLLVSDLKVLSLRPKWVFIDEIQKVPKLLDVVHHLIEKEGYRFILTGSSARKLKKLGSNLLAGRAFIYSLYPLTFRELGSQFDLLEVLHWGSLPKIFSLGDVDRSEFLRAYCLTYLKEEILQEQLVRNANAFRDFLEVAAQENGKDINFTKLGRDLGVDPKTVQVFFDILEDTLVAFRLPGFDRSVRKSQLHRPKYFLFDLGVKRMMDRSIDVPLRAGTSAYGTAFEHWLILECFRLNDYLRKDFKLSHYQTQNGEIDLVLSKGSSLLCVEIKSTTRIDQVECRRYSRISEALRPTQKYYVSQDPVCTRIDDVKCLHWKDFFEEVFPTKLGVFS